MLEGLPPNGAEHVVRLTTDKRRATAIVDLVSETFDPSEVAASAFEAVEDGVAPARWSDDPPWLVELYFADAPDEDGLCALIEGATDAGTAALARFETIAGKDWIEASLAGLPPVRAGRVVVHGAHARGGVRAHEIGIEIEAALAFGTGHHGTTMGCLLFLEDELKRRRPRRALDVGTGTGVLAIAAARALRRRIAASDIDPVSVETARANAVANGAGPYMRPVRAAGLSHPAIVAGGPYDLVLANILQRPLIGLARPIRLATRPGARIILSGLLGPDVPGVVGAYRRQGFRLLRHRVIDGWWCLLMRR